MADPVAGLLEMARVTRAGRRRRRVRLGSRRRPGAARRCSGARRASSTRRPATSRDLPGAREGHLGELLDAAGLRDGRGDGAVEASVELASFDEWWEPFTFGVGPAGAYAQSLDGPARETLRACCRELLPEAPFRLTHAGLGRARPRLTGPAHTPSSVNGGAT